MRPGPFEDDPEPLGQRIHTALAKLGVALKSADADRLGEEHAHGLESELLTLMRLCPATGLRLSDAALALGVHLAAASDAMLRLVSDHFARKATVEDALETTFILTETGRAEAERRADLSDALLASADALPPIEQELLYRTLLRMIRSMQERGVIPVAKLCVNCQHFRPQVHTDSDRPHHCALVGAPLSDRHIRVDCPEHQPADRDHHQKAWDKLLAGGGR